jgi:hypothetical protein
MCPGDRRIVAALTAKQDFLNGFRGIFDAESSGCWYNIFFFRMQIDAGSACRPYYREGCA